MMMAPIQNAFMVKNLNPSPYPEGDSDKCQKIKFLNHQEIRLKSLMLIRLKSMKRYIMILCQTQMNFGELLLIG